MTADEVMREIESMENAERIKLLNKLFDQYFDNRPPKEQIIKEKDESFWGKDDEIGKENEENYGLSKSMEKEDQW